MSTPPTKPKRTTMQPTAGLTTTPAWSEADWARHYARGKGESEARREGLDHGGVVLVGDVWESKDTPCSKAGQYRYLVSKVDGDHFNARNTVLDLAVDGWFADMFALCTLISRAAKPERRFEVGVKVRGVYSRLEFTLLRRHEEIKNAWWHTSGSGGEAWDSEAVLELLP
jgi:hypothetical protein